MIQDTMADSHFHLDDVAVLSMEPEGLLAYLDEMVAIESKTFAMPWSREAYLLDIQDNPHSHYVICLYQNKLVAYAGYWLIGDEGDINNIAVAQAYRGLGIGNKLMAGLMADCKERGGQRMTLEVRQSNQKAIQLYEKMGFRAYGIRPRYYEDNGEGAVIMWVEDMK